jgi:hypothetical protein
MPWAASAGAISCANCLTRRPRCPGACWIAATRTRARCIAGLDTALPRHRGHAHEGEIILDEIVHAGELDLNLRECVGNHGRTRGRGLAQLFFQEIDMQKDCPEGIAEVMRDPGGEAAQQGEMLHPVGLVFQPLALGHFAAEGGRPLLQLAFEPRLVLLELRLGVLAGRNVLHREQDELDTIEAARVQQDRASSDPRKVMRHLIVVEDRILRQNLFQQGMQRRQIPLPIAELIDVLAFGLRRAYLKQLVEGGIGGLHAEVGREDEERFPDRLDNLFRGVLGRAEGLRTVLLGGEGGFQIGDALA